MKKDDIERVLVKSFDYFKSVFGSRVDIGELDNLSDWLKRELEEEDTLEKDIHRNYVISEQQLSRLITSGKYKFEDVYGNTIELVYEDDSYAPSILESGKVLVYNNSKLKNLKKIRETNKKYQANIGKKSKLTNQIDEMLSRKRLKNQNEFRKQLDLVDDLIYFCIKHEWIDYLESLQKLRSDIMKKQVKKQIESRKQKTLAEYQG